MVIRILHPTGIAFNTTKLFHQAAAAHLLHHVLHFAKLIDNAVEVLHQIASALNTKFGQFASCGTLGTCLPFSFRLQYMATSLSDKLSKLVKQFRDKARITETNVSDMLREVRTALLEADVALPETSLSWLDVLST